MAETSTADNPRVSAMHFEQLELLSNRGKGKVQCEHFVTIEGFSDTDLSYAEVVQWWLNRDYIEKFPHMQELSLQET